MTMRLINKTIIITGSTTGIGRAIAIRCAAEGAQVVIHGLEETWGKTVLSSLGTDNAMLHIEDLGNEGAAERLIKATVARFGKIDALVNNAAIVASSNIQTTDEAFLRQIIGINCIAPFMLIKESLPWLEKTHGSVLNIGSVNAWSGEPNLLAYSISKGALMTMTRNLGDTLHRENGVRVNQINPGWVLTEKEILRKKEQGLSDNWYKDIPLVFAPAGRILLPEEIAAAAIYWISDECGPISGQVVDLEQHPFFGRNPPKDIHTLKKNIP
jgi:NAD(P)-dependent dehydrogenase (short-subunit alcohol dehydrogenase family)